jgi:hypothetical protein
MSDFLRDLVGRTLGTRDVVRPRRASTFERPVVEQGAFASPSPVSEPGLEGDFEATRSARPPEDRAVAGQREAAQPTRGVATRGLPSLRLKRAPETDVVREELTVVPAAPSPEAGGAREAAVEPSVHEPGRPGSESSRAGAGRRQTSPGEPAEPAAAAEPAGPAPSRARLVETRVAERRVEASPRVEAPAGEPVPSARPRRTRVDVPASESASEPVVHVHIGRIEVRGPTAPERPPAPRPREPLLSLDDYLVQTSSRRR